MCFKAFLEIVIYLLFKSKFKYHFKLTLRNARMYNLQSVSQVQERQESREAITIWDLKHPDKGMLLTIIYQH